VRPPDCPFESALAAAGSGTCQTGHNAVMASDSMVPVRQDTMQSWLVTVWCLSDRTQCNHFSLMNPYPRLGCSQFMLS
jgi:hypothetical protein